MKVSMVMPTYNRAKYLPTAIRCFYAQTYPDLELIIVDDSTEPITIPIDERIKHIRLDQRRTTGAKRNLGAQHARGEIIVALDDDDWSHPHRVEDQVARLLKTGKAVTGYYDTVIYEEATGNVYLQKGGPPYYVSGSSQAYLKSWWVGHPFKDVRVGEDACFGREARIADQLAAAPIGKMMVIRCHGGNTDVRNLTWTPRLKREDISAQFFEDIKDLGFYWTLPHICSDVCKAEAEAQSKVPVPDWKPSRPLPEIATR